MPRWLTASVPDGRKAQKGALFVNPGEGQVTVCVTATRKHKYLNGSPRPPPRHSGAWPGFPHLRRNPGARGAVTGWLYLSVRQRIVSAWSSNGGLHSARSLENDPNPLEMQHSRLRRLHLASLPIVLFSKETKTTSACEGNVTATNCPKHYKTRVFRPEYAFSTTWTCTWRPQF